MEQEPVAVAAPAREWSLRREWARAFTIMLLLVLFAGFGTFAGVRQLVDQFGGSARQLDRESTIVATLRTGLNVHEAGGHRILAGAKVDRRAFLRQQQEITRTFQQAKVTFPVGHATTDALAQSERTWIASLSKSGLWGNEVLRLRGAHPELQAQLGSGNDAARALLIGLQQPSLAAMRAGLANAAALERLLLWALTAIVTLGTAVTIYFRHRMVKDVLEPVASMHLGVSKLQAGEYGHHIEVARRDELGELVDAFNSMAAVLRESHAALTLRATSDTLTGLPNREALIDRLDASFSPVSDRRSRQESVLFVDVDDFKDVNDSVGHAGGDELLVQFAARLNECVRAHDLVARMGGDEFAIVVVEDGDGSTALGLADRILESLSYPFTIAGTRLLVSVSIGVAQRRPETGGPAELLRQADFAMYMAKGGGKGCYQVFDPRVQADMVDRSALAVHASSTRDASTV